MMTIVKRNFTEILTSLVVISFIVSLILAMFTGSIIALISAVVILAGISIYGVVELEKEEKELKNLRGY